MFHDFWRLQTHAFTDDQKHTASNSSLVDVADVAVSCALDPLGGFTVHHHGAGPDDFVDFLRRRAVLQVASVQSEFFLNALNLGIGGLVVPDVQFPTNHVRNQHSERLGRAACSTDGPGKMD